jgi:benzoate 4-monooxygenase
LQAALDEALGPLDAHEDAAVQYDAVKGIAYLDAVINEGLRLHSTSGIGLPRIVPEGAPMAIGDHAFPPGAILSVPSYTIHRDAAVWGPDPEAFRPERWLEGNREELLKGFNPFSYGPRRAGTGCQVSTLLTLVRLQSMRG